MHSDQNFSKIFKWYVLHVYSGAENTVRDIITQETNENASGKNVFDKAQKSKGLIKEIIIPLVSENNLSLNNNQVVQKKVMSGYMFINMVLCDDSYSFIMSIPKVIGFLGGKKPACVSKKEIDLVLDAIRTKSSATTTTLIEVGDDVEVLEGPLASMNGIVTSIDLENKTASVSISIFGSSTIINLALDHIKKS